MIRVYVGIFGIFIIVGLGYLAFMNFILNEQSSADIQGLGTVHVGSNISHAKFGYGNVKAIHKNESNHTLIVDFKEEGTKALIAEYSPIEIQEIKK